MSNRNVQMVGFWRKLFAQTKAPLSAALVCVVLFIQVLAASPLLHLDTHDDAASASHECAVKTFSQGNLDLTPPSQCFSAPVIWFNPIATSAETEAASFFQAVAPPRGPPSLA